MSAPAAWKLTEVADLNGDRLLIVAGELDIATTPELSRMLDRLRAHGHPVVLDLAAVTFMDSTGLGVLIGALRRINERGGRMALVCADGPVLRVLELTRLTEVFSIFDSVDDAVAAS
jgi:anti-sigma B factor antagonist